MPVATLQAKEVIFKETMMDWRISATLVTLALLAGCNTMHGMGQDVDSVFGTNLSGDKTSASTNTGTSTSASGSTAGSTTSDASGSTTSGGGNGSATR